MGHLTADDRSLLWILRTQKGWGLMAYDEGKEFPNKTMLFGVPLNRWCIAVDDSLQTSSSSEQSLSGANCRDVSLIAP